MEGKGSIVQAVLIVMRMNVFSVSQVQTQSKMCMLKCMLLCHGVTASTICPGLCLKACKKTLPEPPYYCNLGCTTAICTNLSPRTSHAYQI
ncbi:unnamed protein product [Prunus armeniaca]